MRKYAVAASAIPVLAMLYAPIIARRLLASRVGAGLGMAGIALIVSVGLAAPEMTQARPPVSLAPVSSAALTSTIAPSGGLRAPIALAFSTPMDAASVSRALSVVPAVLAGLSWDAAGKVLSITPIGHWAPDTYYTVTIASTARDRTGRRLTAPAHAVFATRKAVGARISAAAGGSSVTPAATFVVAFEGPVDSKAAEAAFRITPAVEGSFESATDLAGGTTLTFAPAKALATNATYTISLEGVVMDADGAPIVAPAPLTVRTLKPAAVVRFRPLNATTGVSHTAALSVRFTDPMDRASTAAAFTATVGSTQLKGQTSWAEGDTVLVFEPSSSIPYGSKVVMRVGATALDQAAAPLVAPRTVTFTVESKPAVQKPAPATTKKTPPSRPISTGGKSVGSGSWRSVEAYYLKLMNCTRGGGWVTSGGSCSSPGGSGIAPLILSSGISTNVSRPYAKLLATRDLCDHFIGGTPGDRLRAAGYSGDYRENIGCRSGDPFAAVLGSHLFFQDEKPCGGYCHYANIMSTKMKYVGIGVWVASGRVRLVVDFWQG